MNLVLNKIRTTPQGAQEQVRQNIKGYERLISKMARKYVRPRVEFDDLVQEGMIGLMLACRDFNPERSTAFHTYAIYRIKGKMYEYCIGNESPIYVPTHVAKAGSYIKQMQRLLDREPNFMDTPTIIREIMSVQTHACEKDLNTFVLASLRELKRKLGGIAGHSKMKYEALAALAMQSLSLVVSDDILTKFPKERGLVDELVSNRELNSQLREYLGEKKFTVLSMRALGWNHREIAAHLASIGYTNREGRQVSRQAIKGILNDTIRSVEKMSIFKDLKVLFKALKQSTERKKKK